MNIRSATADDWSRIVTLLDSAGLPIADLDGTQVANFLVAYDGSVVTGAVAVESFGSAGLLRSLVVDAGFRGEGLGRRLTEAAELHAHRHRLTTLFLLSTTAASFFEQRGYVASDRLLAPAEVQNSAEFARLCPASAICLSKALA
jgi:amino-acid N-acetyltransferase